MSGQRSLWKEEIPHSCRLRASCHNSFSLVKNLFFPEGISLGNDLPFQGSCDVGLFYLHSKGLQIVFQHPKRKVHVAKIHKSNTTVKLGPRSCLTFKRPTKSPRVLSVISTTHQMFVLHLLAVPYALKLAVGLHGGFKISACSLMPLPAGREA